MSPSVKGAVQAERRALIGVGFTGPSMLASALAAPTRRFPFDRLAATPLVIALQGAWIAETLRFAALDAIRTLPDGSAAAPTAVVAYGEVTGGVSLVASFVLVRSGWRHRSRHPSHPIWMIRDASRERLPPAR